MRIGRRMIRICGTGVDIGIPVKTHVKVASPAPGSGGHALLSCVFKLISIRKIVTILFIV
jgi:hypothetical protein